MVGDARVNDTAILTCSWQMEAQMNISNGKAVLQKARVREHDHMSLDNSKDGVDSVVNV